MPIYEFKCSSCGEVFSKLIIKKDDTINCPFCKSEKVERIISSVATFSKGTSPSMARNCGSGGFS
jgi:putative FmdB family regulatory protein